MSDVIDTPEVIEEKILTFKEKEFSSLLKDKTEKAQTKLLKDLGFEDINAAKETFKKYKEKETSEMSEIDKYKKQIESLENEKKEILSRTEKAEAKSIILGKGVDAAKVDRVVKLLSTYDGEIDEKITAILNDFPEFIKQTAPQNLSGKTSTQALSEDEKAKAEIKKAFGLK